MWPYFATLVIHFQSWTCAKAVLGNFVFSLFFLFFCLCYIGVGGVCWSPLPAALHYLVTDFNCIPWKGRTHTNTYMYIHICFPCAKFAILLAAASQSFVAIFPCLCKNGDLVLGFNCDCECTFEALRLKPQ